MAVSGKGDGVHLHPALRDIRVIRRAVGSPGSPFRIEADGHGVPVKVEWTWRHGPGERWLLGGVALWLVAIVAAVAVGTGGGFGGALAVVGLLLLGDIVGARGSTSRHGTAVLDLGGPDLVVQGLPEDDPRPLPKDEIHRVDLRHDPERKAFEVFAEGAGGRTMVLGTFSDTERAAYLRAVVNEVLRG